MNVAKQNLSILDLPSPVLAASMWFRMLSRRSASASKEMRWRSAVFWSPLLLDLVMNEQHTKPTPMEASEGTSDN